MPIVVVVFKNWGRMKEKFEQNNMRRMNGKYEQNKVRRMI